MIRITQSKAQGKQDSSRNSKKVCGMRVKTHIRAGDSETPPPPPGDSGGGGDGGGLGSNHNETMLRLPRKGMRVKTHIRAGGGGDDGGGLGSNHNETML